MSGPVIPIGLEGSKVRLFPGFAWWRVINGNGRPGGNPDAENMLFDAGSSIRSVDPVVGFWRDDAEEMDWLEDFLCDPHMAEMIGMLLAPEDEEEELEEEFYYSRKELTTLGSDIVERS